MKYALIAAMLISSQAHSHEAASGMKYSAFCCSGNSQTGDCQAIPSQRVRITAEGYMIELRPGDHRLVTAHHLYKLKQSEARQSEDGDYHVCLYPTEDTLRCFYSPPMGY